jgi:hypothetical protein
MNVVEDAELLPNEELVRMWRDKVIVFAEKWERRFQEEYAV